MEQTVLFYLPKCRRAADAPSRIGFQAASAAQSPKGSLKNKNRLVFSQAVFCWVDWLSGCLISSQPFNTATLSPTSSRTQHLFFGKKHALVRRRAKREARLVRTRRKKDAQ